MNPSFLGAWLELGKEGRKAPMFLLGMQGEHPQPLYTLLCNHDLDDNLWAKLFVDALL